VAEPLADLIVQRIVEAARLYYRLVLIVAPSGAGKTRVLQEVADQTGYERVNINLELSRRLLDFTEAQRPLSVDRLMGEIVDGTTGETVLLDNIEILFDVPLKQNPLLCLQRLSRNRTVVAAWSGTVTSDGSGPAVLTYATPGHLEYRSYPAADILTVSPEGTR
jgi:hypothetical protein